MDVQLTLVKALVGLYYNGFKRWLQLSADDAVHYNFKNSDTNLLARVILIVNILENAIILCGLIFADV